MLTKRILSCFFILALFFSQISIAQTEPYKTINDTLVLNLEDCLKLALENNQKVVGAGYAIEAAQQQLKEANAAFWPILEYEYRVAPVPTDASRAFDSFFEGELAMFNSFKFRAIMPVFASGQLSTARKLGKHGVAAARQENIKLREQTIYEVKQLYYAIQLASELDKLLANSVEKINSRLESEESKEISDISPFDLLKLKVFKVELEKRLDETQQNKEIALHALKVQMGLDENAKIKLSSELLKPEVVELSTYKKYLQASAEHRPEFKLLEIGVDAKKLQYKLEKQKMGPTAGAAFFIDLGRTTEDIRNVGLTNDYDDPFNFSRAGAGLQISGKLDFHGATARIRKAKAEYLKASYEKMMARNGLALDLEKAYRKAERQKNNVNRAQEAESMARQMLFLAKSNLDIGVGDEDDYTDALQLVLLSRGQYFQAVFEYNTALAELEQKVGSNNYEHLTSRPNIPEYEMFNGNNGEEFNW
ncbi:MAG: TolC family protein [Pseudomonadota bacterium]